MGQQPSFAERVVEGLLPALLHGQSGKNDELVARMQEQNNRHQQDMQMFMQKNADDVRKHKEIIEMLQAQIKDVQKEPFDPKDPDRLVRTMNENFDQFCQAARVHLRDVPKKPKTSIAVLGPSGVGKSTIINCFAGKLVTPVDVVECTQKISMVHANEAFDIYDVPGSRDERADFYNIDSLHQLKSLHCVLVVYTDRFEHVLNVSKLLKSIDLPFIFVRNKCDFQKDGESLQRGKEKEEKSAGQVPLVYLGYDRTKVEPPAVTMPGNFDQLKDVLTKTLAGSSASKKRKSQSGEGDQKRHCREASRG